MIAIEYQQISKQYRGNTEASVKEVSAQIHEGEFITILGSSGCGKTTLLKMTNRLIDPTSGTIQLFQEDISKTDPVQLRRKIGYVIQQVGLFPHMTIFENISLLMNILKWDKNKIESRVKELLDLVRLDSSEYKDRYPSQLSGGQQQRVGVARALAVNPRILLFDEPFGAIDAITRMQLQNELIRIHEETKHTFIFVTRDINEAFKLGNRVMIMNEGKLVQFDTPEQIIKNPSDPFVQSLIDSVKEQNTFWENIYD